MLACIFSFVVVGYGAFLLCMLKFEIKKEEDLFVSSIFVGCVFSIATSSIFSF